MQQAGERSRATRTDHPTRSRPSCRWQGRRPNRRAPLRQRASRTGTRHQRARRAPLLAKAGRRTHWSTSRYASSPSIAPAPPCAYARTVTVSAPLGLDHHYGVFRNSCGRTSHEDRRVEIEAAENAEPGVAADGVPQQDAAEEWTTTFAAARFTGPDYCTLPAALRHAHRRQESREIVLRGLDGVLRVRGGLPPHVPAPSGLPKSSRIPSAAQHPFSARCTQIHCQSWTGRKHVSQNC